MELKVKWDNLDQNSKEKDKSRAKTTIMTLGTAGEKRVESPSRGIKVSSGTSDFELWHRVTKGMLNPQGLAFLHRGMQASTLRDIAETNGKFNRHVSEASAILDKIDNKSIKVIFPRIPATEAKSIILTDKRISAYIDFLNLAKGNDANILPLPPTQKLINRLDEVKKGIESVYSTTEKTKQKPLLGYIPSFDNPNHAEKMVEMYLDLTPKVIAFVIDFSGGRRDRTANVVIRRLMDANKKKDLGDFYVHAVDVPKDLNNLDPATPFYDLPLMVEGIDSFHNRLFGGGGKSEPKKGQSITDFNKMKRYAVQSQYGSFNFEELKKHKLLSEICNCPVCGGVKMEDLFGTQNIGLFQDMLSVHRINIDLQEAEEQKRIINDGKSILDYLRKKPMAKSQIDGIMTLVRGID